MSATVAVVDYGMGNLRSVSQAVLHVARGTGVEVIVTDEFKYWYDQLAGDDEDAVYRAVGVLEAFGVALGYPQTSAIEGSRYALRELRVQSGGRPLRIFYAFDTKRDAVLIIGGDKTGKKRFYEEMIPRAEQIWEEYLTERANPRG